MDATTTPISDVSTNILQSEISFYTHADEGRSRYQVVVLQSISDVRPIHGMTDESTLKGLAQLCRAYLLPKHPEIDALVLFTLRDTTEINSPEEFDGEIIVDRESCARVWFNRAVGEKKISIRESTLCSIDAEIQAALSELVTSNCLELVQVRPGSNILFMPVCPTMGLLSKSYDPGRISVNAHFFLMDFTDLETHYDIVGEPYGLLVTEGKIIQPPLYPRATLLVSKNNESKVEILSIENMGVEFGGTIYTHTEKTPFYRRPDYEKTPSSSGLDIAIVGKRIVGYKQNGDMTVPEAGFVIHCESSQVPQTLSVAYHMEGIENFGIQVGPALVINGDALSDFGEPYYSGTGTKYPPTVYPQGWNQGHAARMGIGIRDHKPVILWVEGSKDAYYTKERDSLGLTLAEFADVARNLKIDNCINLDGGGSSQLALGLKRELKIADRFADTLEEFERPIPIGLSISL